MAMRAALRSSPWSISTQVPLAAASTSRAPTEWCTATALDVPWRLDACDVATHSASFVALAADASTPHRIHCQVASTGEPAEGIDGKVSEEPHVVVMIALSLAMIVYLIRLVRETGRHAKPQASSRCVVVDVFRGLTLCVMVFVNYGGGGFALFQHSAWDGLTVADVVFPSFAWIMGFTMSFSTGSNGRSATPWWRIFVRSIKLFSIGLFLNNGPSWAEWRIPGVLQSLSAGYWITECLTSAATRVVKANGDRLLVSTAVVHAVFGIVPIVAVNLALTFGLAVPGCPRGYLGPGGDSDGGAFRDCTGGAHLLIDLVVFGERRIYQTPTCQDVFHTGPYDPEGLLNWLMVAATVYTGVLEGMRFKAAKSDGTRAQLRAFLMHATVFACAAFLVSGSVGLFAGIPVNKNLWSLSYVLVSVAVANAAFAALLFFGADHPDAMAWTTLAHVGHNSIFIYTMHEILQSYVPFSTRPLGPTATATATGTRHAVRQVVVLLQNVAAVLWWVFVAAWMHARGIIITV